MALSIERDCVTVVKAQRSGAKWRLTGGYELAGSLDPLDSASLKRAVEKAVDGASLVEDGGSCEVAVSIGDRFAKVGIFAFDEFPESAGDALAIVRLRAKKEFALSGAQLRLDYQVIDSAGPVRVLVVAIDEGVAAAIEGALKEKGLEVGRMGLCSFHLANLLLEDKASSGGNFSVATIIDSTLTLLIFAGGKLDFYRSKTFKGGSAGLAGDIKMSFVSYGGGTRDALQCDGEERLTLFTATLAPDEVVKVEGVETTVMRPDVFLDSADATDASDSSDISRLAAIGACL